MLSSYNYQWKRVRLKNSYFYIILKFFQTAFILIYLYNNNGKNSSIINNMLITKWYENYQLMFNSYNRAYIGKYTLDKTRNNQVYLSASPLTLQHYAIWCIWTLSLKKDIVVIRNAQSCMCETIWHSEFWPF